MPVNVYEALIMLDTSKVAGDVPAVQQQLHAIMDRNKVEVLASRPWDERRLAYPIHGQKKALFYLIYFKGTGEHLVGIEHDLKLNETVLRAMTLRIEPKLEETMLSLARDPHALALQAVVEEPDDYSGGGRDRDRDRDRGPRREPREAPVAAAAGGEDKG
ncbi:MAG TPA: 30S ribosomal protein S6 [Gemmataceae bacterium]|jgi:small subunit ribosomal protein S6|nr:30S ribosomal protein S6 [Gemmataceae bacterium]